MSAYVIEPRPFADKVVASGSLRAEESVDLRPEMNGRVVEIRFREGERVRRGDLLVRLNDAELKASLVRARHELELAEAEVKRSEPLLPMGAISASVYDSTISTLKIRQSDVDVVQAQLDKTTIRAPFDGLIGLRAISVGAYVTTDTTLVSMQRLDNVKLDFAVPERYTPYLRNDITVSFRVAGSSEQYIGKVYAYEPRIDTGTRTALLRAICPNPDGRLLPGAYATVEMPLQTRDDVIFVPADAVIPGLDEHAVYIIERGKARYRKVQTGLRTAGEVQILAGLERGDKVITSGLQQVHDGTTVDIDAGPAEPAAEHSAEERS
ncbi:efflux RND transporter periplasmic adaptor subunit [Solimonas soli]|uniref:efflux RND transporter periplasmic adaptor subunit n=1 Tax=Solimonas soli TaxID=413479 RepID=UPI0004AD17AC|nr:efflux RND transporter periplasmic adaptor subunit [Solimonas soli]